jgi:hypothetical protein
VTRHPGITKKKAPMARIRADPIQNFLNSLFLNGLLTCGQMFVLPGLATVATIGNVGSSWARRVLGTRELELTPEMGGVDAPESVRRSNTNHRYITIPIGADGAAAGCKPPASCLPACRNSPAR